MVNSKRQPFTDGSRQEVAKKYHAKAQTLAKTFERGTEIARKSAPHEPIGEVITPPGLHSKMVVRLEADGGTETFHPHEVVPFPQEQE